MIKVLERDEANILLASLGLRVGDWNELTASNSAGQLNYAYVPPTEALELYVVSQRLTAWLGTRGWTLLQIDNSTSPTSDERRVFEAVVFEGKTFSFQDGQRSFLFNADSDFDDDSIQTKVALLVYFALLFGWHVHLTSRSSSNGKRLALLDTVAYCFGDETAVHAAEKVIDQLTSNPLAVS